MNVYFAYGSNLNRAQMRERCPDAVPLEAAKVPGYGLGFSGYSERWRGGGCCLIPSDESCVYGGLYKVSREDLKSLDYFEGVPEVYRRGRVNARTQNGESVEAIAYLKTDPGYDAPSEKYLKVILEGCEHFGISARTLSRALTRKPTVCARLFVYGTLRRGGSNHRGFLAGLAGAGAVCGERRFFRLENGLPAMTERSGVFCEGERYDLSSKPELWPALDKFEGFSPSAPVDSLYERCLVLAESPGGEKTPAWAYQAGEKTLEADSGFAFNHFYRTGKDSCIVTDDH